MIFGFLAETTVHPKPHPWIPPETNDITTHISLLLTETRAITISQPTSQASVRMQIRRIHQTLNLLTFQLPDIHGCAQLPVNTDIMCMQNLVGNKKLHIG